MKRDVLLGVEDVKKEMKVKRYKMTPQREHIFRVLLENQGKHLCVEDIYNLLKKRDSTLGLATVYRTVELFQKLGFVQSIDFDDGRKRYEVGVHRDKRGGEITNNSRHHHHHLICVQCGKIIEMGEDLLDELEVKVKKEFGFVVTDHQLKLYGCCKKCLEK